MKPALSLMFISCLVLLPIPAGAQTIQSFEDLPLRINLGDQVRVKDESGARTAGRLTRFTRDEITIQTDAGEKRLSAETVRDVAVRGHSLGKSALIGAGAFAVLAIVAASRGNTNASPAAAGMLGAGAGLAIGALIPQMKTIYRQQQDHASVQPSRSARGVHGSLLEDLALRVNLDDELRVEDVSGGTTVGRLTALTADEMAIQTEAAEKHFAREIVRQVAVRRQPIRAAVLIGAGAGAALGALAACTGSDRGECVDGPIMLGALGAGLGLAVGAAIHRTTLVYPEPEKRIAVWPAISRDGFVVRIVRRW
jgi:hypothetical protein